MAFPREHVPSAKTRSETFASSISASTPARDPRAFTLTDSTCMNERRRPPRRGRGPRTARPAAEQGEDEPVSRRPARGGRRTRRSRAAFQRAGDTSRAASRLAAATSARARRGCRWSRPAAPSRHPSPQPARPTSAPNPRLDNGGYTAPAKGAGSRSDRTGDAGAATGAEDVASRARAPAGRAPARPPPQPVQLVATGETTGWFDPARDGGFVRRAQASYLADAGDAYVAAHPRSPARPAKERPDRGHDGPRSARAHRADRDHVDQRRRSARGGAAPPRVQHAHRDVPGAEALPRDRDGRRRAAPS